MLVNTEEDEGRLQRVPSIDRFCLREHCRTDIFRSLLTLLPFPDGDAACVRHSRDQAGGGQQARDRSGRRHQELYLLRQLQEGLP